MLKEEACGRTKVLLHFGRRLDFVSAHPTYGPMGVRWEHRPPLDVACRGRLSIYTR